MPIEISEELLYDLVFRAILKVPECGPDGGWGCLTGEPTHDLIFAFFLPHIVLFIFLFVIMGAATPGSNGKKGIQVLFSIGVYIFLIYTGYYGLLASWLVIWMALTVFIGLAYFFMAKILPSPDKTAKIGKHVGGYVKKSWDRDKKLRKIDRDIQEINNLIRENPGNTRLPKLLAELKMERNKIQSR